MPLGQYRLHDHQLPGLQKWTHYGGDLRPNVRADSRTTYGFETDVGEYKISPVGDQYGRFRGYEVMKEWSRADPENRILNGYRLVRSPNEALRIAREDYAERRHLVQRRL